MKLIAFLLLLPNPKESFDKLLKETKFERVYSSLLNESITQNQMVDSLFEISKKAFQIQSPLPIQFYQKLSYLVKDQKGEYSREFAEVIHNIARKYANENDQNTSLLYNQYARKIRRKSLSRKDIDIARSYNNIGNNYERMENQEYFTKNHYWY